jgi:hypothetical protein
MCGDNGRSAMPAPRQKSMQRPNFSQSPKRVGSGPGGPPVGAAGRGVLPAAGAAGDAAGDPNCASFAVRSTDATSSAAETGMATSVPELPITDHRASAAKHD